MLHSLFLLIIGIGLGLGAAVPIGPVNVEIARRTLARGRLAGMALGFGAALVDVCFAIATSLGAQKLLHGQKFEHGFGFVGVAICFILAGVSLYSAWRAYKHGVAEPKHRPNNAKTLAADFATGFGMTALNLYSWIWWFVTVPALAIQRGGGSPSDLLFTGVGVAAAIVGWVLLFTAIINKLRQFAGRSWHIGADLVGGGLLLVFGIWALVRVLQ